MTPSYRSKFEETVHKQIPSAAYEPDRIRFVQPAKERNYKPDFVLSNGIIIEAKGRLDTADREKMVWVKAQHPDLDIRFVFQNSRLPIRKGSKTTYSAWADKHGFPWCEKTIPATWLTELPDPERTNEAFRPC